MDDAGAIIAHQAQHQGTQRGFFGLAADRQLDIDAGTAHVLQLDPQRFDRPGGYIHPQDAGELPGHPRHAAVQPVATVPVDGLGEAFHQPGLVGGNHGENQRNGHGVLLAVCCRVRHRPFSVVGTWRPCRFGRAVTPVHPGQRSYQDHWPSAGKNPRASVPAPVYCRPGGMFQPAIFRSP